MKKSIQVAIPIILFILFILIMNTGNLLKHPIGNEEDFLTLLETVEKEIMNENWNQANEQLTEVKKTWSKIVKRVQFSTEKDEIIELHKLLERTEGYIKVKDKNEAVVELTEARHIWEEIGK